MSDANLQGRTMNPTQSAAVLRTMLRHYKWKFSERAAVTAAITMLDGASHKAAMSTQEGAPPAPVAASTPAAQWRVDGEPDPHAGHYDGERAALCLGHLTDDELANGVFMNADQPMNLERMLAKDPTYHPPIAWLTAAKERIRWLSRALENATTRNSEPYAYVMATSSGAECLITAADYRKYYAEHPKGYTFTPLYK